MFSRFRAAAVGNITSNMSLQRRRIFCSIKETNNFVKNNRPAYYLNGCSMMPFTTSRVCSSQHDSMSGNSTSSKGDEHRRLQMVPHTRSREHWKVLLSNLHKNQTSAINKVSQHNTSSNNTLYLASVNYPQYFHSLRKTAIENFCHKASDLRNSLMSTLSSKGYIIQDVGSGSYPEKVSELSKTFQKSLGKNNKSILLVFQSAVDWNIPFSEATAMVANKYNGVYASTTNHNEASKKSAVAGRALFQTNMLVIKVNVDETFIDNNDLADLIDCWNQQTFGTAPRTPIGEPPEWWLDEELLQEKIKDSARMVEQIERST